MGKLEEYRQQILPLLGDAASFGTLQQLLISNSGLPGPRGNLELAAALADAVEAVGLDDARWQLLLWWADISAREAPTGDPREFLPFCALEALGAAYGAADSDRRGRIVELLKGAARDARWRMREGVAMGFQRIGEKDFETLRKILWEWLPGSSLLEQRAMVATLAHPPILKHPEAAQFSLRVGDEILGRLVRLEGEQRKTEEFRVLRQGLEYALSVFVDPLPGPGFAFLEKWAGVGDPDVRRIVKSNLGKARLAKKYPDRVQEVTALL